MTLASAAIEHPRPASKRRWLIIVVAVAFVVAGLVTGAYFLGSRANTAASNTNGVPQQLADLKSAVHSLNIAVGTMQTDITSHSKVLSQLQTNEATDQANGKVVTQILQEAGTAVQQLEAQMVGVCQAVPGCKPMTFSITPAAPVSP